MIARSERLWLIAAAQEQVEQRELVTVAMRVELAKMYPGRSDRDSLALIEQSPGAVGKLVRRIEQRVNGTDA